MELLTKFLNSLIPWLPFIGSILVVVLGWLFGRRKESASIVNETSEAVLKLLGPLNDRIDFLTCRTVLLENTVKTQEDELELLRPLPQIVTAMTRGIHILISQLRKNEIIPEWTPEDLEPVLVRVESELQNRARMKKEEEEKTKK
jgi:hypothetical protein